MSIKITSDLLMRAGACKEQRVLFAATFPDGAEMNEANLQVAFDAGLNLSWFVLNFFRVRYSEYSAEIDVVMAAKNLRMVKLEKAYKEEKMGYSRYRLAFTEVQEEQAKALNVVARDFILRYWQEDYGDDARAYWFSHPDVVLKWALRTTLR